MTKATNDFGELGERVAARWLERQGYTVLARRWRSGHRDIDVIAERDGIVAFVEVKTRAALEFGDPVQAVHAQKQRSLVRSAREWMARHDGAKPAKPEYRFDVIGVLLRDRTAWIRHIESAFTV
ncbi:MAG: YraN family protein [Gemmatimonadaceae bacterium]|jgi:putative endonuclease